MTYIKKSKGLFIGLLVGGAIGGAIALLYAPKSGKRLRNDISRKTNELIAEGRKKTFDTWNETKQMAEDTYNSANDFLITGMDKIARKSEKVKEALKAGFNS